MSNRLVIDFSLVILLCIVSTTLQSQDSLSLYDHIYNFPDKLFGKVTSKTQKLQEKITKQTGKYLSRMAVEEKRLKKKLKRKNAQAAEELFGDIDRKYEELKSKLIEPISNIRLTNGYNGHLDSMKTTLNFFDQQDFLKQPQMHQQVKNVMRNYNLLQTKFNGAETIAKYLEKRQQQLKSQIEKSGLTKRYRKFQKDVYYYRAQIDEYKRNFEDPSKLEVQLLQLANKIPGFNNFFAKHSELANLFRLPDNYGTLQSLQGLQARDDVQLLIQQRIQSGGPNAQAYVQQNLQQAQVRLTQLKEKFRHGSFGDAGEDMPDFKSNNQKTKSFLKRLEYGTNIQSVKANRYFPTTSDIGLSMGYKLNDKSIIGIGASYKMGWGTIRNIRISSEGIGLRGFIDWKLKGKFFVSGGYEQNYRSRFNSFLQLKNLNQWQESALLGISKKYQINKKLKGNIKLMYDFLFNQQIPETQPIIFRIGYNF